MLPGELLLDEISKLPEADRSKLDYEGICQVISLEIAAVAIKNSIDEIAKGEYEVSDT